MCFPVNFVKFLRTPFLQNTSGGCFFIIKFNHQKFLTFFVTSAKTVSFMFDIIIKGNAQFILLRNPQESGA